MKRILHLSAILTAPVASVHAAALLQSGDAILAFDSDAIAPASSYPAGEPPSAAIDGTSAKYLNDGNAGSGFIVTPSGGASVIQSFVIQTGNDANWRDPAKYQLYGTNDSITSADNSSGGAENWTLISSGTLGLPNDRNVDGSPVSFSNSTSYTSYKVVFTETKYIAGQQAMQFNEFTAYTGPGATGSSIIAPGSSIIAIDVPVSQSWYNKPDSYFANYQGPANLLDGDSSTKYLNYGKENSGFIVTPSAGPSIIDGFTITTANDSAGRDPASYAIYGTSVPLTEDDNSFGTTDLWTLISTGTLDLSADRLTTSDLIPIDDNQEAYTSYKFVVLSVKDSGSNSTQYADVQFYGTIVPEPSTFALGSLALLGLAARRRR